MVPRCAACANTADGRMRAWQNGQARTIWVCESCRQRVSAAMERRDVVAADVVRGTPAQTRTAATVRDFNEFERAERRAGNYFREPLGK